MDWRGRMWAASERFAGETERAKAAVRIGWRLHRLSNERARLLASVAVNDRQIAAAMVIRESLNSPAANQLVLPFESMQRLALRSGVIHVR